jgi:dimethylamine/trimethylamine dehydrogenase
VLLEIGAGELRGQGVWAPDPVHWHADAVVLVTQREPQDALHRELTADRARLREEGIEAVYRIGDCVAPRLIADCIFDGHRLAREIDSADPATPLPFLRELPDVRRVVAAAAPAG